MSDSSPFLSYVPKDPIANLKWRIAVREAALDDVDLQDQLRQACFSDLLFFFNGFLTLVEPRATIKEIPFITWPHQDGVFLEMDEAISSCEQTGEMIDVLCPKSREQGGTFGYLGVILRRWLRDRRFKAGLVTRNEDMVDSKTNEDTLIFKLVAMLEALPFWLRPRGFDFEKHRLLSEHILYNPETQGTIKGSAAVADLFRQGRLTVLAFDEAGSKEWITGGKDYEAMASTSNTTRCRILVSTYGADSGMFFESCQEPMGRTKLLKLDWRDNPVHSHLAFTMGGGFYAARNESDQPAVNEYVKENKDTIERLVRRGFLKEHRLISPWYIGHCLRPGATPRSIAREIDMDARGAVGKVFESELMDAMKKDVVRPPVWQGTPKFDPDTLELLALVPMENGPLKLWFQPGLANEPPDGPYTVGADIAAGGVSEYASNSSAVGLNRNTGEQVMEYVERGGGGAKFGRTVVGLCRWLRNAFLGWESSGVSGAFGKEIIEELFYPDVYYPEVQNRTGIARDSTPGWKNNSEDAKDELFSLMKDGMAGNEFLPRSEDLIRECCEYEYDGGKVVHKPTKLAKTDAKGHGDRCIAAGVAWLCLKNRQPKGVDKKRDQAQDVRYNTIAYRIQEDKRRSEKIAREREDGFGIRELLEANQ